MKLKTLSKENKIALFFLFVFGVFVLFKPPIDPDFGWHLKYGEYNYTNKTILKENIFSYTFPSYFWANSYWLTQLIIYFLFSTFGAFGLSIVFSVLFCIFLLKYLLNEAKFTIYSAAIVFGVLTLYMGAFMISIRPLFFSTIFMFVLTYVLLKKHSYARFLPLLFLIWANMHADYLLGLFVYGVFTAYSLYKVLLKRQLNIKTFFSIATIPLISVLVTFINPYMGNLLETLLKETHPFAFSHIAEMTPVTTDNRVFFAFNSAVLSVVVYAAFFRKEKIDLWYLFCIGFFFVASVRAQYFIRPFLVLSSLLLVNVFDQGFAALNKVNVEKALKKKLIFVAKILFFFTVLAAAPGFFKTVNVVNNVAAWSRDLDYPYDAVGFIKETDISGNMFNAYDWGGYLIWQLPEHKTFIDGRMAAWRIDEKAVIEDYITVYRDPSKLPNLVDEYNISWVIDRSDSKLSLYLEGVPSWEKVYDDDIASIFIKSDKMSQ